MAFSTASLLAFWWISAIFTFVIVILRITYKLRSNSHWLTAHDVFLTLAVVLTLIAISLGTRLALAMDAATVRIYRLQPKMVVDPTGLEMFLTPTETGDVMKLGYMMYLSITLGLWSTKATLAAIYFSVLAQLPRYLKWLTIFIAGYLGATFVAILGMLLFWCERPQNNWTYEPFGVLNMECYVAVELPIYIAHAFFSMSADILLLVTGLLTFRILHLSSLRHLIGVIFLSSTGILSAAASLVRVLKLVSHLPPADDPSILTKLSGVYSLGYVRLYIMWSSVELISAVFACSLPALRTMLGNRRKGTSAARSGASESGRIWQMRSYASKRAEESGDELRSLTRIEEIRDLEAVQRGQEVERSE